MTQPPSDSVKSIDLATLQCSQSGCQFAVSGECMDGLDPADCENLTPLEKSILSPAANGIEDEPNDFVDTFDSEQIQSGENSDAIVYAGRAMNRNEAEEFLKFQDTVLIVIAGQVDSGKTTLASRAFVQFLNGPTKDWRFAGSQTLLAFDERIYRHRHALGQNEADTLHTAFGIEDYFHLQLQSVKDANYKTLILHDLSGENYEAAINSSEAAATLDFIPRADVLCFLLSGSRLNNQIEANSALSKFTMSVRAIFEEQSIHEHTKIILIVTMWDRVVKDGFEEQAESRISQAEARLKSAIEHSGLTQSFETHRVASISHTQKLNGGFGFDALFQEWVTARDHRHKRDEVISIRNSEGWGSLGEPTVIKVEVEEIP